MTTRHLVGAALLALGLGYTTSASAMNLQPGMLTMMQQGGTEHGVQYGCVLPGYDPSTTCTYSRGAWMARTRNWNDDGRRSRLGTRAWSR